MALQAYNNCFMSIDLEDDAVVALSKRAGQDQILQIRIQAVKEVEKIEDVPAEEEGSLSQIEINYV